MEEGVDVSIYAKPEYYSFQMEEIRESLEDNHSDEKKEKPIISFSKGSEEVEF